MKPTVLSPCGIRRARQRSARSILRGQSLPAVRTICAVFAFQLMWLSAPFLWASTAHAAPLPVRGRVVSGWVGVNKRDATHMKIFQVGRRAVVQWDSFDIEQGSKVEIIQPSAVSIMINRVTGSGVSTIAGDLKANGSVVLVNPNGIVLQRSAKVEVANFVASSVALSDSEIDSLFVTWRSVDGSAQQGVEGQPQMVPARRTVFPQLTVYAVGSGTTNSGTIRTHDDGYVGLVGKFVHHDGVIIADGGQVAIVGLGSSGRAAAKAEETVNLSGTIRTGTVMPGLEQAHGGRIAVDGRDGVVNVSGVLMASVGQRTSYGVGGDVGIAGRQILLRDALVDVRGAVRGGAISLSTSSDQASDQLLRVDARSSLFAQAQGAGNGGDIHLSSAGETRFEGAAVASGERALSPPHANAGAGLAVSALLRRDSSVTTLGEGGSVAVTGRGNLLSEAEIDVSCAVGSTKGQVHLHGPTSSVTSTDPRAWSTFQSASSSASASAIQQTRHVGQAAMSSASSGERQRTSSPISLPAKSGKYRPEPPPLAERRRPALGLSVTVERSLRAGDPRRPIVVTPVPSQSLSLLSSGSAVANARSTRAVALPTTQPATPVAAENASIPSWEMIRPARLELEDARVPVPIPDAETTLTLPNVVSESVAEER